MLNLRFFFRSYLRIPENSELRNRPISTSAFRVLTAVYLQRVFFAVFPYRAVVFLVSALQTLGIAVHSEAVVRDFYHAARNV